MASVSSATQPAPSFSRRAASAFMSMSLYFFTGGARTTGCVKSAASSAILVVRSKCLRSLIYGSSSGIARATAFVRRSMSRAVSMYDPYSLLIVFTHPDIISVRSSSVYTILFMIYAYAADDIYPSGCP